MVLFSGFSSRRPLPVLVAVRRPERFPHWVSTHVASISAKVVLFASAWFRVLSFLRSRCHYSLLLYVVLFVGPVHHIVLSFPCLSSDRCLFAWSCVLAFPWKVPPVFSCSSGVGLVWKPIPLPPFYFVLNAFWSISFIFLIKTDHQVILVEKVEFSFKSLLVGLARSGHCSVSQFQV